MSSVNMGERIRQLCLGLGMSVRTLATESGFSPSLSMRQDSPHGLRALLSLTMEYRICSTPCIVLLNKPCRNY